jgi:hypothetical protein
MARSWQISIAEWVRQAFDLTRRRESVSSVSEKLEVIYAAARHDFPASDIDDMLSEIETGYSSSL